MDSEHSGNDHLVMFRPPVNRAMCVLDRSFFRKTCPLSAATVFDNSNISRVRGALSQSRDILSLPRLNPIQTAPPQGSLEELNASQTKDESKARISSPRKCLLLREDIKHNDTKTWSPTINALVEEGTVGLGPYDLILNYDYWTYSDIIGSILPEDALTEIPVGFTEVGHVLHLNLREQYLPYKHLIAEILLDKNSRIRTVINKTEDVGSHSEFRTFQYEVLAGVKDMNVEVREHDCLFRFDYSRVYWNSRLDTEHRRLVEKFDEGQMVCDVMAGVGPFAIPAGKKRIFVHANDLNPYAWEVMEDAIRRNKVTPFVKAFNMDGREFIRRSAIDLIKSRTARIEPKVQSSKIDHAKKGSPASISKIYVRPTTVDHYVMNLPATAIEFLDAFIGVYTGHESSFAPYTSRKLPIIHVYCFSGNSEDEREDQIDICKRISGKIGFTITPDDRIGCPGNEELELEIYNVRLVSPKKQMFCASFRLPREVAFR